jgi:hypothetical protein
VNKFEMNLSMQSRPDGYQLETGTSTTAALPKLSVEKLRNKTHIKSGIGGCVGFLWPDGSSMTPGERLPQVYSDFSADGLGTLFEEVHMPFNPPNVRHPRRPTVLMGVDAFGFSSAQQAAATVTLGGSTRVRNTGFDVIPVSGIVIAVPGLELGAGRPRYPPSAVVATSNRPATVMGLVRPSARGEDWVVQSTITTRDGVTDAADAARGRQDCRQFGARLGRVLVSGTVGQHMLVLLSPPTPALFGRLV